MKQSNSKINHSILFLIVGTAIVTGATLLGTLGFVCLFSNLTVMIQRVFVSSFPPFVASSLAACGSFFLTSYIFYEGLSQVSKLVKYAFGLKAQKKDPNLDTDVEVKELGKEYVQEEKRKEEHFDREKKEEKEMSIQERIEYLQKEKEFLKNRNMEEKGKGAYIKK